jgi:hypothetical protein
MKMMNEKINALFNVCGFPNDEIMEIRLDANKSLYIQRFAELIIQECLDKIETHNIPVGNSPAGELAAEWTYTALEQIRDTIKEHFGVK